ncbi:hypothetical protein ABFA25_12980 [Mycobacterium lepromatosis]|uniref:hypothetical protein n=1 Tax=Mycobacterium lepromatosis TaxID=480418 RepID=UPI003D801F14
MVFSNGLSTPTRAVFGVLVVTGGSVNALVPLFAIGVCTGFAMAGYGMANHHLTRCRSSWRCKLVVNLSAEVL